MTHLKSVLYILACFSLLSSTITLAAWYKGDAQHPISELNYDEIRAKTIKNAIANAALKSSSYIRAEDIALDGLLLSSKTVLQSEGHIRRVDIISETIIDELLHVVVNVDFKSLSECQQSRYAKSLLITQFPLLKPLQARTGAIFDFDRHVSKRLERQLTAQPTLVTTELLKILTTQSDTVGTINSNKLLEKALYLANLHQRQFILFGFIRDISLFEQVKDNILLDDVSTRRNFTLQIYLVDAISGKYLIDKSYHSEANWQYPTNHQVDTNNSLFWRNDFGRSVLNTINSAVTDITTQLRCQPVLAQIVKASSNQLIINIGHRHGVKVGDTFEVVHQQKIFSNLGQMNAMLIPKETSQLTVEHVSELYATVLSQTPDKVDNVQINDYLRSSLSF